MQKEVRHLRVGIEFKFLGNLTSNIIPFLAYWITSIIAIGHHPWQDRPNTEWGVNIKNTKNTDYFIVT